jgi:hypothetical protein
MLSEVFGRRGNFYVLRGPLPAQPTSRGGCPKNVILEINFLWPKLEVIFFNNFAFL